MKTNLDRPTLNVLWGPHDLMVTAAHRYCLGRMSYIVSDCVLWLIVNWDRFEYHTKKLIQDETRRAIEKGCAGMDMDVREWQKILELKNED